MTQFAAICFLTFHFFTYGVTFDWWAHGNWSIILISIGQVACGVYSFLSAYLSPSPHLQTLYDIRLVFVSMAALTVIVPSLTLFLGFYMFQVSDHIRIYTTSVSMISWGVANLVPAMVLFPLTYFMWQVRLIELRN